MNFKLKKNNLPSKNLPPRLFGGQATRPQRLSRLILATRPPRLLSGMSGAMAGAATYPPATPEQTHSCDGGRGNLKPSRGFTLVELMVTLSLFVVLTTIVLFSNSKFNGSILLTNLAYDVAITIRQAQTFGVNVRETPGGTFQSAYGVHFDINNNNKQFILFADKNIVGNDKYKYNGSPNCNGGADECIDKYSIKRGNYISKLCITDTTGGQNCSIKKLDIAFKRPNPDAKINNDDSITQATIIISSADDSNSRRIVVNSTGQISVER